MFDFQYRIANKQFFLFIKITSKECSYCWQFQCTIVQPR